MSTTNINLGDMAVRRFSQQEVKPAEDAVKMWRHSVETADNADHNATECDLCQTFDLEQCVLSILKDDKELDESTNNITDASPTVVSGARTTVATSSASVSSGGGDISRSVTPPQHLAADEALLATTSSINFNINDGNEDMLNPKSSFVSKDHFRDFMMGATPQATARSESGIRGGITPLATAVANGGTTSSAPAPGAANSRTVGQQQQQNTNNNVVAAAKQQMAPSAPAPFTLRVGATPFIMNSTPTNINVVLNHQPLNAMAPSPTTSSPPVYLPIMQSTGPVVNSMAAANTNNGNQQQQQQPHRQLHNAAPTGVIPQPFVPQQPFMMMNHQIQNSVAAQQKYQLHHQQHANTSAPKTNNNVSTSNNNNNNKKNVSSRTKKSGGGNTSRIQCFCGTFVVDLVSLKSHLNAKHSHRLQNERDGSPAEFVLYCDCPERCTIHRSSDIAKLFDDYRFTTTACSNHNVADCGSCTGADQKKKKCAHAIWRLVPAESAAAQELLHYHQQK